MLRSKGLDKSPMDALAYKPILDGSNDAGTHLEFVEKDYDLNPVLIWYFFEL